MDRKLLLTCFAVAVLLFAGDARAGTVLRVGPQRPFKSIQSAVNAAVDGDLILVDAGRYAPFDVTAKSVAILSADAAAPFTMIPDRNRPVVRIRVIARHQCVTVSGWRTEVRYGGVPALEITTCFGCVRLRDVVLAPTTHLGDVPMDAVVSIQDCASVSLYEVDVWSDQPRRGRRVKGISTFAGLDHGLSAMLIGGSTVHLHGCRLRGYDNAATPTVGRWGGDGLRLHKGGIVRIDGGATQVLGGAGGEFGGSAIHMLAASGSLDVGACGVPAQAFGRGAGPKIGGVLARNHDRGIISVAVERLVPGCLFDSHGTVRAPARMRINQQSLVAVQSFFDRNYTLAVGPTRVGRLPGFLNALHLDLGTPLTRMFAVGVLRANVASRLPIRLPDLASLAGIQFGVQAALGPPRGRTLPAASLTSAEMVVITP